MELTVSKIAELRQARAARVQEMRGLLDKADVEKRDLSSEEQTRFDALKGEVTSIEQRIAQRESLDELDRTAPAVPGTGGGETRQRSIGELAAESAEIRSFLQAGRKGSVRVELEGEFRAVTNLGSVVAADRRPGIIAQPTPRLYMRDLLPIIRTTGSSVEVVREGTFTNAASTVVEATGVGTVGQKPESNLTFSVYSTPVQWIAHWIAVSRSAMDDMDALRQFLDFRMRNGLAQVEEAQILSGNGISPNLAGLTGAATAYQTSRNVAGDKRTDVVHHAISQLAEAGIAASAVVLNLADWMKAVEQKDANGQYLSQGPFGSADQPRLWSLPVVASPVMASGTFLVGDFLQAATIYSRLEKELTISSEHADFYTRNLLAVRAEERIALGINVPGAMVYGSFGAVTA
jgi:HK97 family phage major capsid protein